MARWEAPICIQQIFYIWISKKRSQTILIKKNESQIAVEMQIHLTIENFGTNFHNNEVRRIIIYIEMGGGV